MFSPRRCSMGTGGAHYVRPVHLAAQASTMIDIGMLIAMAQPDANGNLIPSYIQEGSVVFSNPKGRAQWMTLAVCGAFYNPVKATCGETCVFCYGYSDPEVTPSSFSVAMENTVQLSAQATYADGSVDDFTGSSSWSSDASSVATVGASTGLVTPVSAGSVAISAQFPTLVVYTGEICTAGCPVPCPTAVLGAGASGTVADATPVIYSIIPDYWLVGATTTGVVISGKYFGTSPIVSFSDPAVACTQTGASDTLITCNITVGANASGGVVNVTVTSQGYNGSGFMPMPNGGSRATSSSYPGNKQRPTFVKVVKTQQATACLDLECMLELWYQVLDTNQNPIQVAGQTMAENVVITSEVGCTTQITDAGKWQTDPTGTMPSNDPDKIWTCFYPTVTGNCVITASQTFTVNAFPVQIINGQYVGSHNVITFTCNNGQQAGCPSVIPTP